MHIDDITERGFTFNEDGKVLDNCGNEYRNEYGQAEWVEVTCQHCKKVFYMNPDISPESEQFCSDYCRIEDYNNS